MQNMHKSKFSYVGRRCQCLHVMYRSLEIGVVIW